MSDSTEDKESLNPLVPQTCIKNKLAGQRDTEMLEKVRKDPKQGFLKKEEYYSALIIYILRHEGLLDTELERDQVTYRIEVAGFGQDG